MNEDQYITANWLVLLTGLRKMHYKVILENIKIISANSLSELRQIVEGLYFSNNVKSIFISDGRIGKMRDMEKLVNFMLGATSAHVEVIDAIKFRTKTNG